MLAAVVKRFRHALAPHARGIFLTGGVDRRDDHLVGVIERWRETLANRGRSGIAVGLKDGDDALISRVFGGLKRGRNLARQVGVVLEDVEVPVATSELEPPRSTTKRGETRGDRFGFNAQREGEHRSGSRIRNVMNARDRE